MYYDEIAMCNRVHILGNLLKYINKDNTLNAATLLSVIIVAHP